MTDDLTVHKTKFDAVLRKLANSRPITFREAVDKPKAKKGGGIKRSRTSKVSEERR